MIIWLNDWLRSIIAIILLAVFVELLLPNKAMQRYARLVVGLFVLLTILSPILKLIQGDMAGRLEAGLELWDERAIQQDARMPTLEDIQKRAEEMAVKRERDAAVLVQQTLQEAMKKELVKQMKAPVRSVDVELAWIEKKGKNGDLDIRHVVVELDLVAEEKAGQEKQNGDIQAVEPVSIAIRIDEIKDAAGANQSEADEGQTKQEELNHPAAQAVRSIIAAGWGVPSDRIQVRIASSGK